jgi:membrane protein implicated in regulation of membrane protease activity
VVQSIIPPATGRIRFRGTLWDAAADETIEEGEMVEIVRYAGNSRQIYFVKKIEHLYRSIS